ncbi:hypothetical protein BDZ97DRAFT_1766475 [Flammula alnicola]|nr:hypothetical protein BDZ97DRAFT_1766475 [Flammula alnicola]
MHSLRIEKGKEGLRGEDERDFGNWEGLEWEIGGVLMMNGLPPIITSQPEKGVLNRTPTSQNTAFSFTPIPSLTFEKWQFRCSSCSLEDSVLPDRNTINNGDISDVFRGIATPECGAPFVLHPTREAWVHGHQSCRRVTQASFPSSEFLAYARPLGKISDGAQRALVEIHMNGLFKFNLRARAHHTTGSRHPPQNSKKKNQMFVLRFPEREWYKNHLHTSTSSSLYDNLVAMAWEGNSHEGRLALGNARNGCACDKDKPLCSSLHSTLVPTIIVIVNLPSGTGSISDDIRLKWHTMSVSSRRAIDARELKRKYQTELGLGKLSLRSKSFQLPVKTSQWVKGRSALRASDFAFPGIDTLQHKGFNQITDATIAGELKPQKTPSWHHRSGMVHPTPMVWARTQGSLNSKHFYIRVRVHLGFS